MQEEEFYSISAIRIELPELYGKSDSEVLDRFRELFGEPDQISLDSNKNVDWFWYDHEKRGYRPVTDGSKWGFDIVLGYGYGFPDNQVNISFDEAFDRARDFIHGLNVYPLNMRIVSYSISEDEEETIEFKGLF